MPASRAIESRRSDLYAERVRRLLPLLAVLALAGCGETGAAGGFEGEEAAVAEVVDGLAEASRDRDEGRICEGILTSELASRLGDCEREIGAVIDAADTTDLGVEDVSLQGADAARARVRAGRDEDTDRIIGLVRISGRWRIDDLGARVRA
jgi:hypothetical protein